MPALSPRLIFKIVFTAFIVPLAVWLLWPPREVNSATGPGKVSATDFVAHRTAEGARYTLTLAPGSVYLPGIPPSGFGKPLSGLAKAIQAFEERFPDTRVEIRSVPTNREYLITQLTTEKAPDIINALAENVWADVSKNWYIPLDDYLAQPNPFIPAGQPGSRQWWDLFKYQAITRGRAAPDGKLYCLSYDMQETGIYYNKTIFRQVGVEPPRTWEEFLAIGKKLRAAGYTPLQMFAFNFNGWTQDLFFDQLYNSLLPGIDLYKDPIREPYLDGYLDWFEISYLHKKGFFTRRDPRYVEMWRQIHEFRQMTSQNLSSADPLREFITQRGAMIWNASGMVYRLLADPEIKFEWGVFYLPPFTKATTPWASLVPQCVIGGAATTFEITNTAISDTDPKLPFAERLRRSERLKRALAFLQFITTPPVAEMITDEYPSLLPNIVGVPVLEPLRPFDEILHRPYATSKWVATFGPRFVEIQSRMLELYLSDQITLEEFLAWMEKNIDIACETLERRNPPDHAALDREWARLAPERAKLSGLPASMQ